MEHKAPQQGDKQLQTKNSEDAGARMWLTPPAEANALYETVAKNLDAWKQQWRHSFGIPYGNVNASSTNDSFEDSYKVALNYILRPIYEFFKKFKEETGLDIEVPELSTTIVKEDESANDEKGLDKGSEKKPEAKGGDNA
jgi:hypothetical protein